MFLNTYFFYAGTPLSFPLEQAGADIVPVYFFGNTLLHDLVGGEGDDNWLYRLSRKVKQNNCR